MKTLKRLASLPVNMEPRWDAQNPYLLYMMDENRRLSYELETGNQTILHDFKEDFPEQILSPVWARYEGSPSMDTRYFGFMAEDENWVSIALVVYDRWKIFLWENVCCQRNPQSIRLPSACWETIFWYTMMSTSNTGRCIHVQWITPGEQLEDG